MATLSTSNLTLLDWAKRVDPNGKVPTIVELLEESNEILTDMTWMEGNLPTGHRTTVRTGLPTVAWRLMNAGVTPSKSKTSQITEQTGQLVAWSEVDVSVAKLNGNVRRFRMSEAMAFLEAMNQEMAQTLFYGNPTSPEEFVGLANRYSDTTAGNGQNIVLGGGSGSDNSSIWLICWGDRKVSGIFPKGSKAGLEHKDHGLKVIETVGGSAAGTRMEAYQDRWSWDAGIALEDWRYAVRIANIDISNLVAQSNAADLPSLMIQAMYRIPNINVGKAAFYMNRTCAEYLDIERRSDVIAGGGLTYENVDGRRVMRFRNVPIRIVDQLTEAESAVS